jgi:hypothetical protein
VCAPVWVVHEWCMVCDRMLGVVCVCVCVCILSFVLPKKEKKKGEFLTLPLLSLSTRTHHPIRICTASPSIFSGWGSD